MNKVRPINSVIFDFDGTIADSFGIFIETLQEMLKDSHQLSQSEIEELRGLPTSEIINRIGIKKRQVPQLVINGRKEIAKKMDRVDIFEGMSDSIRTLAQNYSLYIVSTNSEKVVTTFLEKYNLRDCIIRIYTGSSLTGKAKKLKSLLQKEQLCVGDCVYVGDETRDIEATKKIGMRSIAVGWGYATPDILSKYNPDALVLNPLDLEASILSIL